MISLTELLHSIDKENKDGFVNIDNWRWTDVDHLITMGFDFGDDYHFNTNKDPKITIYKKREKDKDGKRQEYFYIEEKDRATKRFKTFNDVIEYFDNYEQPSLHPEDN
jgi:hypothetical protein